MGRNDVSCILHRSGFAHLHGENTREAVRAARNAGCYGIETDVRETSDGVIAVVHDRTIATSGREIDVSTITFDELLHRMRGLGKSEPMQLEDVCQEAEGALSLMIDVKVGPHSSSYHERIRSLLESYSLLDSAMIIGDHEAKATIGEYARTAVSLEEFHAFGDSSHQRHTDDIARRFLFVHGRDIRDEDVAKAADIGLPVVVSINWPHYREFPPAEKLNLPLSDCRAAYAMGVRIFQIDSDMLDYVRGLSLHG